jgi:hypothetical protein
VVSRRRVLYIHGFDPRGPAVYHRMFAEEAARQARVTGAVFEVGPRRRESPLEARWSVRAEMDGATIETLYGLLRWDDVVRGLWTRGEGRLFVELWIWFAHVVRSGLLSVARREARPAFIALLLPPAAVSAILATMLLLAAGLAGLGAVVAAKLGAPAWAGACLALLAVPAAGLLWRDLDRRWNIAWLSRCLTFIDNASRGRIEAVQARAAAFAAVIAEAARHPEIDELLIVGHSQGAPMAILALARALRLDPALGEKGPRVSLLTLGQPIFTWDYLAGPGGFRDDLSLVADCRRIAWLDVTSPADGASACGLGPLHFRGDRQPADRPLRRSPRWHLVLTPNLLRRIRRRPFEHHFQYLKAVAVPRAYDYFRLTCGPEPLERFAEGWTALVHEAS